MWYHTTSSNTAKTIKLLCRLVDCLDSKNKLKWDDVFKCRFGPANDTLLQIIACLCYYFSQTAFDMMDTLMEKCIEKDRKDVIFAKNEFGMNTIDWLMATDHKNLYADRSRFARMLLNKCKIDKEIVEKSYKKAMFSRELFQACDAGSITRIKALLNEMKEQYKGADVSDVLNMAIFDTRSYNHCSVKFNLLLWLF